jgi:hypothetical protein
MMTKLQQRFIRLFNYRAPRIFVLTAFTISVATIHAMPPDVESMRIINNLRPIVASIHAGEDSNLSDFDSNLRDALTSNNDVARAIAWWIIGNLQDSKPEIAQAVKQNEPNLGPYSAGFFLIASAQRKDSQEVVRLAQEAATDADMNPIQRIELCKAAMRIDQETGLSLLESLISGQHPIPLSLQGVVINSINRLSGQKKHPPRPIADDNYKLLLSIIEPG